MKCEWICDHLTEVVDGLLTPAEQELVDAHLAACEECCSLVEEIRADAYSLRTLGQVEVPVELRVRIADAVSKPINKKSPWKFFFPRLAPVAAAVLVSVLSINMVPTYLTSRDKSLQQAPEGIVESFTTGLTTEPPQPTSKVGAGDIVVKDVQPPETSSEDNASMRSNTIVAYSATLDGAEHSATELAAKDSKKPSMWVVSSAAGSTVFLLWGAFVFRWYKRQ